MKGNLLLAMAFAVLGMTANAQEKKNEGHAQMQQRPSKEQMMEMQVNRMANQLMLDESTTAKFAPVYKKYLEEMGALRPEPKGGKSGNGNQADGGSLHKGKGAPGMGRGHHGAPEMKQMTDAQVEEALKARWEKMRKTADIQEKYYKEFSKFLTAKQIQKIMESGHGRGHHSAKKGGSHLGKGQGRHGQRRGQNLQNSRNPKNLAPQGTI